MRVSIVIPVLDQLEFTRQCLDRIWRNTGDAIDYEVIVVDNGSVDGTGEWFSASVFPRPVQYHRNAQNLGFAKGNNIGVGLARGKDLLFLNNDTLVQPGWLTGMLRVADSDGEVGIVGIKQLFPYTNIVYHTGVVFAPGGLPQHLYPHLDASLPHVNKEREYQAVTGACLLISRSLFNECGGFDEAYVNGYEDTDLCMAVAERGRKIVCCTSAFIYHYGQISAGRTADDDQNAARFARKWAGRIRVDRDDYLARDRADASARSSRPAPPVVRRLGEDCLYFADDLGQGSAQTWVNAELVLALKDRGAPVFVNGSQLSPTLPAAVRSRLQALVHPGQPVGGVQIKWSHYWPRHLNLELAGDLNLEIFVINYLFGDPGAAPWDYWLQCLRGNPSDKLPVSEFCRSVLLQLGLPERQCHVLHHGYSREIGEVATPDRRDSRFRFLTVTNSHDLGRYNTQAIIDAFDATFGENDDVALVIKDYGASSGDTTVREQLGQRRHGAPIDYISAFTDKRELIRLYKSCDAYVSAHRGEGFGMKILDAMACGLPVVTPLFGGPTAYCRPDNCFPVSFAPTPVGDCLDTRSLKITNSPIWAEVDRQNLGQQLRVVSADRRAAERLGAVGRSSVIDEFSWDRMAGRLIEITAALRQERARGARPPVESPPLRVEHSPYWLGLRVSVVVPTRNRKEKLLACLTALERQSVLPQEFEVLVVDDGSTDGTAEALASRQFPFALRYYHQAGAGPGAARNLGIAHAAGEIVLFIGDDINADAHMIEEHLLAHAGSPDPGVAILGHIDWPPAMTPNAVMDYVCGDAMLQFAYSYIPKAPALDHRFFYTSNISLKRWFLLEAADAGIGFDSCFRRAAFEDSEFAFRLMPRGLQIRYAERAHAVHDHWMDIESFSNREFGAGEMAVVFYRKHPGQDEHLQVRWLADLVEPAAVLRTQPDLLGHLEAFDRQTDSLLRALAGSLDELMAMNRQAGASAPAALSTDRLRAALHGVLRVVFDVQRTRGKVSEWFSMVADPSAAGCAQTLAGVTRKIEFLNLAPDVQGLPAGMASFDLKAMASLKARMAGLTDAQPATSGRGVVRPHIERVLRRLLSNPAIVSRLMATDRYIQARLQASSQQAWLDRYRSSRRWVRRVILH